MRTMIAATLAVSTFAAFLSIQAMGKDQASPLLRHVVLFKFKETASKESIQAVEQAFAALPKKIDSIVEFEWGTDVSVEQKSKGFTHCFFVSFKDEAGRAKYLPHPEHQKFVKLVGPVVDDVCVVDYFAK